MIDNCIVLGQGLLGKTFLRRGYNVLGRADITFDPEHPIKLPSSSVVINCVAKSKTRWCEDPNNFEECLFVNGKLPGLLSKYCKERNILFVHISTGCLYDRVDKFCEETDFLAAHCVYTLTKWVGENRCLKEKDLILRPRLMFSTEESERNVLCRLNKFQNFLEIQNSFTSTDCLVDAIESLVKSKQCGIFNVACKGFGSPYELAGWMGKEDRESLSVEDLHSQQGIHLVNNIMNLKKLEQFYTPPQLKNEVCRCWDAIKEDSIKDL